MKPIDNIIYIGRFQPFHNAHLATIEHAMTLAKNVIVVVGSANQPRDDANPFTDEERIQVIYDTIRDEGLDASRVHFISVENSLYSDAKWALDVSQEVSNLGLSGSTRLIGHSKDETTFYLNIFPQWGKPIEMPLVEVLDATTIREMYFSDKCNMNFFKNVVPRKVLGFLEDFRKTSAYQYIMREAEYIRNYRKQFEHLPYPPVFMTADCVVFKDNHVVLIERRSEPGKGQLALPGGFLNANTDKDVKEAAIRELFEETKIKVPEKIIRRSIVAENIFSALGRSRRGRVITCAQLIVLDDPNNPGLPKLKGSDDARTAQWVPLQELDRKRLFEDHYDIIKWGINLYH